MTTLRKLTLAISNAVVRYASPGCKDWAEGLLQEAALIQDDWTALRWALGSTRLLLDRREARILTLAEASARANKFIAGRQNAALIWWIFLVQTFHYSLKFFDAKTSSEHIGCAMAVLATLPLTTYTFLARRRMNEFMNADIEDNDDVLFYKKELQRSLELFPGGLILFSSVFVFFIGTMMSQRGGVEAHLWMSTFFGALDLGIAALIVHGRHVNQRRLNQLEALLSTQR